MNFRAFLSHAALGFLASSQLAFATPLTSRVDKIQVFNNTGENYAFLYLEQKYQSACPVAGYLIFDLAQPNMKVAYATALTAQIAGKTVTVEGSGVCSGGLEFLKYLVISN